MRNGKELILARENLLEQLVADFSADEQVLGIFLGGSLAAGNADEFSDIDLRLVLADDCDKISFLKSQTELSAVLFVETLADDYVVLHFDCFVKVDIFAYFERELLASAWLKKMKIIKDNGFLAGLAEQSENLDFHLSQAEFNFFLMKFYANVHEFYRRNGRGEENYVEQCGNYLKNILANFWLMALGEQPNSLGDWSKIEGVRSKLSSDQLNWLTKFTPITDRNEFLEEILLTGLSVILEICQKYKLEFDEEKFKKVMKK